MPIMKNYPKIKHLSYLLHFFLSFGQIFMVMCALDEALQKLFELQRQRRKREKRSVFKEQNKNIYPLASHIFQALYLLHLLKSVLNNLKIMNEPTEYIFLI